MSVTVYVVRHAEAANPKGILYGRLPRVDLSERGRGQAVELADAMSGLPLAAIYASPLLRARRTAAAIATRHPGLGVRRSKLLLENRHPCQGQPQAEVAKLGDRVYDPDVLGADGETIEDLRDRLVRFLRRVSRDHQGGVVAVVAHADPIAALRAHLLSKPLVPASLRQEAPPPAGVFRIEWLDDGATNLEWFWRPPTPPTGDDSSASPSTPQGEGANVGAAGSTGGQDAEAGEAAPSSTVGGAG